MERKDIEDILSLIRDPATGQSIVARGMVRDLKLEQKLVSFSLVSPSFTPDHKARLLEAATIAIQEEYPHTEVHIHFVQQADDQGDARPLPHIRNIIAVASGKGGVGKSTVSVNLALSLQQMGARVGLLDADLYGPSIPTMLGLAGQRPKMSDVHGTPRIVPLEVHGMSVMSIGFIVEPEQAVVLRGPRLAGILRQFFEEILWPELDYLIVDLPPGTGDIQLTMVQTVAVTGVVMVTTPQEVALADAIKAMNMFLLPQIDVPVIGVVENMSWFTPEELPDHKYYLFGEGGGKKLAKLSQSVLLGQLPIIQGIREGGDSGQPAALREGTVMQQLFADIARKAMAETAMRHELMGPGRRVKVEM